jgi:hypothetical protein
MNSYGLYIVVVGDYMGRKTIALSLDETVYLKYQEFCKKNYQIVSRKIEAFMVEELKNNEKK